MLDPISLETNRAVEKNSSYLAQLDGLRALAVLAVIYGHASASCLIPNPWRLATVGPMGVTVFFVISGFVITRGLLAEKERFGKLRLLTFFVRRVFRILPAVVVFLFTVQLMALHHLVPLSLSDLTRALTFTANYHKPSGPTIEHMWSLSDEEQFYFVWPLCMFFLPVSALRKAIWLPLLLCPVLRIVLWFHVVGPLMVFRRFELTCDGMALGCLLAMLPVERSPRLQAASRWLDALILSSSAIIFLCCLANRLTVVRLFSDPLTLACAGCLVAALAFSPASLTAQLLASAPFAWIGRISFSLYLWQQLFLLPSPTSCFFGLGLAVALLAAFVSASISYYFIEAPLRRVGRALAEHWDVVHTSDTLPIPTF